MHFHRVASQFFNQPLLLRPESGQVIGAYLHARMRGEAPPPIAAKLPDAGRMPMGTDMRPVPYQTVGHTAVISIVGEMVDRGWWMNADSGLVSYEGVRNQLLAAAADVRIHNVLLDVSTPGGSAIGAFETAALIREVNKEKPVIALANGMMTSAGYALGSAARHLITIPSGVTGSIGVIWVHLDFSKMLEMEGVKPTIITEPADGEKSDANPYEPLAAEAEARIRDDARQLYEQFLASVALDKRLTAAAARKTKAGIFIGKAAVEAKLADDVGTYEEVLAEMVSA